MACLSPAALAGLSGTTRLLELGCGQVRRWPGSITVDVNARSRADVVHDLNSMPYPFEDNWFDLIIGEHVIEHLQDVVSVMEELHRITRPGGIVHIEVPHFSSANFFTDPTHRHPFSTRSFDYFIAGTVVRDYHYSTVEFKKKAVSLSLVGRDERFRRFVNRWANRNPNVYESKWAFVFPAEHINFELEVLK